MDARDLYGLPLDRFVPERTALAKTLRQAGDRDEAKAVTALRKPSAAAWAVNQLVRTQAGAIAELFEAGDAVQRAQADLIAGQGNSGALRQALNRERQAVAELVGAARGLLTSDGHELSPATLERVSETLDAAALEEEARAQIRDGCLDRELRRVGLGVGPAPDPPRAKPKARASRSKPAAERKTPAARERKAPAREQKTPAAGERKTPAREQKTPAARHRNLDLRALRKAEADTRRAAERAARDLRAAQTKRKTAAQALEQAEAAVDAAAERARAADAAHEQAERNLGARR